MLVYLLFILGFVFLIKGADLLIDGASSLSRKYKVPEITIGLTVVALGTSLPELIVNILSSLKGEQDLILGNIAGSNIANTLLVLGAGALFTPLLFSKNNFKIDIPIYLGSVFFVLFLVYSYFIISGNMLLTRMHGIIMLFLFGAYMYLIFKRSEEFNSDIVNLKLNKSIVYILFGAIGLFLGGRWVVNSAIIIATDLGISMVFIGSTIIALGTSLPELVTTIIGIVKKKNDLAVGNIIGSNIFNLMLVLGLSAIVTPVFFNKIGFLNFLFASLSMILVGIFLLYNKVNKNFELKKIHGLVMILIYFAYIFYMFFV